MSMQAQIMTLSVATQTPRLPDLQSSIYTFSKIT